MSNFQKTFLVARREFMVRLQSRAFQVAAAITLLILIGGIVIPQLFADDEVVYEVAVVGAEEELFTTAEELANARSEDEETIINTTPFDDVAAAVQAVEEGEVEAALVGDSELVVATESGVFGGSELVPLLQEAAATTQLSDLLGTEEGDRVLDVLTGEALQIRALDEGGAADPGRNVLAYGGTLLLYIAILTYGSWVMTGVTEEKTSRVSEVLLSTVRPWQLLSGKLLGIGFLGMVQFALTVAIGLTMVRVTGLFDLPAIPIDMLITIVIAFVLGFLIYASLFAAAGSLVSRAEDAQAASAPLTILAVAGYIISIATLGDPDGVLAQVGTFVPLLSPFVVPIRVSLQAIEWWQIVASVVLTIATIALVIGVSARIYAGGLLNFGERLKIGQAWRQAEQ